MLELLSKLFGSKSNRDIKLIQPLVEKTKEEYSKLRSLSNDELRQRTIDFKARIQEFLEDIDKEIAVVKTKAESEDLPINEKTALYDQLDKLQKDRDKELEKVLIEISEDCHDFMRDYAAKNGRFVSFLYEKLVRDFMKRPDQTIDTDDIKDF